MTKKYKNFFYSILFILSVIVDQVTKWFAVESLQQDLVLNNYLNFSLMWNRGISWGLFHSYEGFVFYLLTSFIIAVILFFFIYTLVQYKKNFDITFEILILSGAVSNIIDRFVHGAVVDFIEFHIGTWYWPTFNIADAFIVLGVAGIVFKNIYGAYVYKD